VPLQRINTIDMPWCGLLVDTHTLEVKPCMRRVLERPLRLSTSVECVQPGLALRRAIKSFVRMKCHAIVLDSSLNSYSTVYRTIYMLHLVAAMRTHVFIASMHAFDPEKNSAYIIQCIVEAVSFGARLTHSRTSEKVNRELRFGADEDWDPITHSPDAADSQYPSKNSEVFRSLTAPTLSLQSSYTGVCPVSHQQALWLGFHAFWTVLNKRRGRYNTVAHALKNSLTILERGLKNHDGFLGSAPIMDCHSILSTSEWL
jgi:hypothetical protein